MAIEEKKQSPRKQKHVAINAAQHEANVARCARWFVSETTREQKRTRKDNKGREYEVVVTKRVRESKALRKLDRQRARDGQEVAA